MKTFAIPVIFRKDKNDPGVRVVVPLDQILFLRVTGKQIFFYAKHGKEYSLYASFSDWRILTDGVGFDEVDRGTLVNVRNILFIYEDLQQVHFGDEAQGLFCPIARAHIVRMQQQYPDIPIMNSGKLKLGYS